MSNKKQTAVKWLYKELALNNNSIDSIKERIYKESEIWKQANKMFEQQIIDACNQKEFEDIDGYGIHETISKGEQYYEQTFNNE